MKNMKKLAALLMALMMLLGSVSALAEDAVVISTMIVTEADDEIMAAMNVSAGTALNVTVEAPKGYIILNESTEPDAIHLTFMGGEDAVVYYLNIVFDDSLGDYTLNDLSDEEFEEMKATLTEDYNNATVELTETGMGTRVIAVEEQDAEDDYGFLLTVYRGYFIEVTLYKGGAELTREEFQQGLDILTSLAFVTD